MALLDLSSPVSYLLAAGLTAVDAVVPVVPSETAIVALGVTTAREMDWRIWLLVGLAAFGAFCGDNVCYLLGRRFGPAIERRLFSSPKGRLRRAWAEKALARYGARLILVCRFVPGGRTAVTVTCGTIGYPRRRFQVTTAVSGAAWACYAFFLGRLGGKAFEDRPWMGMLLALGAALAVTGLIEVGRRLGHYLRSAPLNRSDRDRSLGLRRAWPSPGPALRRPAEMGTPSSIPRPCALDIDEPFP